MRATHLGQQVLVHRSAYSDSRHATFIPQMCYQELDTLAGIWGQHFGSLVVRIHLLQLNEVAAGVVEHGVLAPRLLLGLSDKPHSETNKAFVAGIEIVGEERGCRYALLIESSLIGFSRGILVRLEHELDVGRAGR